MQLEQRVGNNNNRKLVMESEKRVRYATEQFEIDPIFPLDNDEKKGANLIDIQTISTVHDYIRHMPVSLINKLIFSS